MKLTEDEARYRRHLIRTMDRNKLIDMIVTQHLRAYNNNPRSWKNGTALAELYAIPTARQS